MTICHAKDCSRVATHLATHRRNSALVILLCADCAQRWHEHWKTEDLQRGDMIGDTIYDKQCQILSKACTQKAQCSIRHRYTNSEVTAFSCWACAYMYHKDWEIVWPTDFREWPDHVRNLDWDKLAGRPGDIKSDVVREICKEAKMRDEWPAARPHTTRSRLVDIWNTLVGFAIIGGVIWGGYQGLNWYQNAEKVECQTPKIQGRVIKVDSPEFRTNGDYIRITFEKQGSVAIPYKPGCVVPTVDQQGRVCENDHWHSDVPKKTPEATPSEKDF